MSISGDDEAEHSSNHDDRESDMSGSEDGKLSSDDSVEIDCEGAGGNKRNHGRKCRSSKRGKYNQKYRKEWESIPSLKG